MKAVVLFVLVLVLAPRAEAADTNVVKLLKAVYKTERVHPYQGGYLVNANDGAQVIIRPTPSVDRWSVSEIRAHPDVGMLFQAERSARKASRLKKRSH
jgi:hypothetical protein